MSEFSRRPITANDEVMARNSVLRERVAVLERALEKIIEDPPAIPKEVFDIARKALDGS